MSFEKLLNEKSHDLLEKTKDKVDFEVELRRYDIGYFVFKKAKFLFRQDPLYQIRHGEIIGHNKKYQNVAMEIASENNLPYSFERLRRNILFT